MTTPTAKESVLATFRGHAANLTAAADKAATRRRALEETIGRERENLATLHSQAAQLRADIAEQDERLTALAAERDDAHADAETAAAQSAYAQSVIALAEASATETVIDAPEVNGNG